MKTLFDEFEEISPNRAQFSFANIFVPGAQAGVSNIITPKATMYGGLFIFIIILIFTQSFIHAIIAFALTFIGITQSIRQAQVTKVIVEKNGWVSGICPNHPELILKNKFKSLPNGSPGVADEIGGKFNDETIYMSRFSATTGSGKNRSTVKVNVILFKLEHEAPISFSIVKEGFFGSKDDIQVESIEFNEEFLIKYDVEQKQAIMKLITPSLQTLLLDINKTLKLKSIEVVENVLLFSYDSDMFSSFGFTTKVSDSQIEKLDGRLKKLLSFADEVSDIFDKN